MDANCKMSGKPTTWPCPARGCPLFHDCYIEYEEKAKALMPPPTRADRIRAMSDEELADYLNGIALKGYFGRETFNVAERLSWLLQPAEED